MSLREDVELYTKLSGEDGSQETIATIGAYLRGYEQGKADAEPKRGKWILDRSGAYCCSKCMEPCATYVMMQPRDKFCKMCGSRNEVTE